MWPLAQNVLSVSAASSTPPQSPPMMMNVPTSTTTSLVRKFSGEANGKTLASNGSLVVVALHPQSCPYYRDTYILSSQSVLAQFSAKSWYWMLKIEIQLLEYPIPPPPPPLSVTKKPGPTSSSCRGAKCLPCGRQRPRCFRPPDRHNHHKIEKKTKKKWKKNLNKKN